jgi:hypothetical protein
MKSKLLLLSAVILTGGALAGFAGDGAYQDLGTPLRGSAWRPAHRSQTSSNEPAQTVFYFYCKIQDRLAQDDLHTRQDYRALHENALV